jgi:hypothetical protein
MSYKAATTFTLTHTLADDARQQLEPWLEEAATLARSLCSELDFSGALTLVATDTVWAQYPGNITNMADVIANGDPPQHPCPHHLGIPSPPRRSCYCGRCHDVQAAYG